MKKIEKYDGNFKNMDYTFYQMSRQSIKKIKLVKNKKKKTHGRKRNKR